MFRKLTAMVGGYPFQQRDLRLLFTAGFLSFLGASIAFPLRMLYAQQHGASPAQLGLTASVFLLAPLVAQVPMGWLVDHWGRVPVYLVGLLTHPIISFLYIPFSSPTDIIVLRFIEGLSVSAFQPAESAYIADVTPENHRAEAYGAMGATLNAGLLIGPVFGGVLGQYFGFVQAFLISVGVELLAIPLVVGRIREPVVHEIHHDQAPVKLRALFSIPLTGAYLAFFSAQAVIGILTALWAIWVHDLGGSYTYIGLTFSVFALPQILLGASAGRWGERWGRARVMLISGTLAAIIYVAYGFMTNLIAIALLGVVEGIVIVFLTPVAQGFLADASPQRARGRVQGIAGAVSALGGSSAAFISLPLYHDARPIPFVLAGVIILIGSILAAAAAVVFQRRRRAEAVETYAEHQPG
ncbi:MAG: MFS transporter [Chloroflexota bacterium]